MIYFGPALNDIHRPEERMGLGLRDTDRLGKSKRIERRTTHCWFSSSHGICKKSFKIIVLLKAVFKGNSSSHRFSLGGKELRILIVFYHYSTNCYYVQCPNGVSPVDGNCYKVLQTDLHVITFLKFVWQTIIENVHGS